MRIGFGYDVHKLVEDRALVLGGIEVPYELGLLGHSDADVLVHAIMDALLGAGGLGDIGRHFPDTEVEYLDISSMKLLKEVNILLQSKAFQINNIDATIIAERPKLAPFIPDMVENIARCLGLDESSVNVKATTTEGLGFTGVGQGIACSAVCTVHEVGKSNTSSHKL